MNEVIGSIRHFLKTQVSLNDKTVLGEDDSLSETGVIDSITLLQLVDFLESTYTIQIPVEMITPENFDSLSGISQTVMNLKNG